MVGPRHRWTVLGIGVAAQASFSAAISGLPVTGPTMRGVYALSTEQLGFVLGAIYLGITVSEIPWGILTDRFGERRVLLVGLSSTGAMLALLALVAPGVGPLPSVVVLAVGFLLIGALGGSINGSSGRAVMAWFQDGQRGFAMSIRQTAMPAGGAVGIAVLPGLAAAFGFRPTYLVLAALCLVTAVAAARMLHEPPLRPDVPAGRVGAAPAADARSPLVRGDIWRLALASALLATPQFAILTFAAVFLTDAKQAGVATVVATLVVVQVLGGTARIWSGRYTDRHGNRRTMIKVFGALAGVMLVLAAVLTPSPTALVACVLALAGVAANAWHGVAYTEIATMAGAARSGTALGLENTTVFAMGFFTPLLIPLLLRISGWPVVWGVVALVSFAAVLLAPRPLSALARPVRPAPVPPAQEERREARTSD